MWWQVLDDTAPWPNSIVYLLSPLPRQDWEHWHDWAQGWDTLGLAIMNTGVGFCLLQLRVHRIIIPASNISSMPMNEQGLLSRCLLTTLSLPVGGPSTFCGLSLFLTQASVLVNARSYNSIPNPAQPHWQYPRPRPISQAQVQVLVYTWVGHQRYLHWHHRPRQLHHHHGLIGWARFQAFCQKNDN